MTAFARIITIGKNNELPRIVHLPVGVRVDGTTVTAPCEIYSDGIMCPDCDGYGELNRISINPSIRDWTERCERCDGNGIIEEIENTAEAVCLPAPVVGRPAVRPAAGRSTSPGVQPVARAAGDLPCFVGRKTHTVLRSVPGSSASHSPVASPPPHAPSGTFADKIIDAITVLAGLAVFGMIAMFLMVLS